MVAPHVSLGEVARSMVRGAAGAVLDAEQAALADEPDGVHALRTRVRRLRSILSLLREHLDDRRSQRLRVPLREWGSQLGTVRDAEVLAAEAASALAAAGIDDDAMRRRLVEEPLADYARLHARLVALSEQPRAKERMRELHAFAADPPLVGVDADATGALTAVLRREARRVRKAAKRLDGSMERLHDVRKAGRRLRYAAEAIGEAGPATLTDAAASAAKAGSRLHDVLGDHRDAVVLAARLERSRVRAARAGEATEGYDRLIAAATARAMRRRGQLDRALRRVRDASKMLD